MDIVERLRGHGNLDMPLCKESADTIEALRRERDELKRLNDLHNKTCTPAQFSLDHNKQLREQLAAITQERDTFKASYLEQVELHNKTLDELREMERELDELEGANILNRNAVQFQKDKLAASQAREQQLWEALEEANALNQNWVSVAEPEMLEHLSEYRAVIKMGTAALTLPQDNTALNAWGAKLLRDVADSVVDTPRYITVFDLHRMAGELEGKK